MLPRMLFSSVLRQTLMLSSASTMRTESLLKLQRECTRRVTPTKPNFTKGIISCEVCFGGAWFPSFDVIVFGRTMNAVSKTPPQLPSLIVA